MKNWLLVLLILLNQTTTLLSQDAEIDSLILVAENTKSDSTKVDTYIKLAQLFGNEDPFEAKNYLIKASEIAKEAKLYSKEAIALNKLGITNYSLGNYEETLKYFFAVLNIHQNLGDSSSIASLYNNIGIVLVDLGRIEETLEYYEKSLAIKKNLGDTLMVANTLSNIGLVYDQLGRHKEAHDNYMIAYSIDQSLGNTLDVFKDLSNLADNYVLQKNYDSAQYYYQQAVALMPEIDVPYNKAELLISLGRLNLINNEFTRAEEKFKMSIDQAESIGAKYLIQENYEELSKVMKAQGRYKESLEYYEKHVKIQDELFNKEQAEKLAQIENNFEIKSRENQINLLNKESEIKDLRLSNTQMVVYWLAGIILLIVFIIFLQYRKNAFKTKVNLMLRSQNEEIVEKNKNILDSILCAKNIQQAILPNDKKLATSFQEAFVFNKARDIVSGDFYWFAEYDDKVLIAAVDCTGHGVPAAFLNVMGNSILNQIVHEMHLLNPAEVLKELNKRVLSALQSDELYYQVDDGMDIGLCMFDRNNQKLSFAGAKRPLYFVKNNKLNELKGDHYPVGGVLYDAERNYHQHEIELAKGDLVYLFTDGIVDQFGGPSNKKFMYPRLRSLLERVINQPLSEQKKIIYNELNNWQGNNEQTDDMLLIAVRI